ncbi:MAG TPA: hypothetical protein V6C72_14405 [Chroococcales cyanobacterium]
MRAAFLASIVIPFLLTVSAPAPGSAAPAHKAAPKAPAVDVNLRLAEGVGELWSRSARLYARANQISPQPQSSDSSTLQAIRRLGPGAWTKSKIQEIIAVGQIKDSKFKTILYEFIEAMPQLKEGESNIAAVTAPPQFDRRTDELARKLSEVAVPSKERFLSMLAPVFQMTRAAVMQISARAATAGANAKVAAAPPPPSKTISGETYYDDIDGLFDDTRSKIDRNFSNFSDQTSQSGLNQKLLNTGLQSHDMNNSLRQSSKATLLQAGQKLGGGYQSGITQLQKLWQ